MTHFTSIFKKIARAPRPGLEKRILLALREQERRLFERKARLALVGVWVSGLALTGAGAWAGTALLQSEFWSLLSLAFSDWNVVGSSLQDFFYSLLETLPVLPVVVLLIPFFVLNIFASISAYFFKRQQRSLHNSLLVH
jgi:hypothetical protein